MSLRQQREQGQDGMFDPLLTVKGLKLSLNVADRRIMAIEDVELTVKQEEVVCLVGESGCGKSLTALSIGRLLPRTVSRDSHGQTLFEGVDIWKMSEGVLREFRKKEIAYIFQDPSAVLNPVIAIGKQIQESAPETGTHKSRVQNTVELLRMVEIPDGEYRINAYPHQLSGGMQQRVSIAMALAKHPKLLIADEPTTALDVTVQAQILDLFQKMKQKFKMAMLFVTHNLGIVASIADRVAVMYAGQIVEEGPVNDLLERPMHPYTIALVDSIPSLGQNISRLKGIPGQVPRLGAYPSGCHFHPRCPRAKPACSYTDPELIEVEPNRKVRCPYWNSE